MHGLLLRRWRRRWCRWWLCERRRQLRGEALKHGFHVGIHVAEPLVHLGIQVAELLVHLGIQVAELLERVGAHLAELLERVGAHLGLQGGELFRQSCGLGAQPPAFVGRVALGVGGHVAVGAVGAQVVVLSRYQLVGEVLDRSARCIGLQQQDQTRRYHVVGREVGKAPGRQRTQTQT